MAFITMPAPKVGTTFYDKPGNGRKLHKLKRLQDNKVICTPANDDGKEALILPIEAWEKLTGYKIGPDLLATMTFSPPAPAPVAKPAEAKPAESKPAKSAKTTKPAKAAKTPAAKAAEAPAAPLATPISQDVARQLTEILKGQPVWMRLAGDKNAATRQKIMEALTGVKTPKNKSGINAIEAILLKKLDIDWTITTHNEQGKLITARLNEIAAGAPATTPDEVAPEATSDTSDDLRNAAMVTFKEFQQGAQFVTNKGSKRLHVRFGPTVYWVREQGRGKLTAPIDDILRSIHRDAVAAQVTRYNRGGFPNALPAERNAQPVPANVLAEYPDLAEMVWERSGAMRDSAAARADGVITPEEAIARADAAFMANQQRLAQIVKPVLPADAQPITIEIRQIYLNGDSGNLTNINPQRLEAMVANIRSKKRADNGEIVVEMWAPDPQCAFGASQHGPLAQYKIVDGLEQLQAIMHFLDQEGMGGATENIKIPVMLTQPAEPAMTDQQIEQAIVAALEDFNEPIAFTQPAEPAAPAQPLAPDEAPVAEAAEAPSAEDYDEQGRLRPSAMNKKQVKEAIAELVADGWRLVTKRDMGHDRMRLVHEEKRIASYPGNSERFLLIAMRTKMYGPNAKYFQDWLDEEGVQPPTPTAPAQPEAEHEKPTETEAAAAHWEALAKAEEAAAQSEIDQGLPRGDVSSFTARANTYHQVATDMWEKAANEGSDAANLIKVISQAGAAWWEEETAKAAAAAAEPQPAVEAPTSNYIEVKLEQLTFRNNSWDVSDDVLKPIMYNLQEYGPQAADITACVSSYNPNTYLVLSGDEYVTAAVRLKWNTVTLTVVERPFDPVIEEYKDLFIGHNAERQALYEDAKGVRFMIVNGVQTPEPILMVPARGGGITTKTNRTNHPEYKTSDELEAERAWAALVASGAPAPASTAPTVIEPVEIPTATVPLAQIHCAEKRGVTDSTRTYYAELAAKIKQDPSSYMIDVWAWPQDDCLDGRQHYSLTTDYAMENYLKAMRDVLKWNDIPINICQRTEEPFVTEKDGRKFVGHNGKGLALYEDQRGVRSYIEEGWWQTEAVSIIPVRDTGRGTIIETGVDRQAHPNYKTFREIVDDGKREVNLTERVVKGVESHAPEAPAPPAKGPFTQPVQVMGVGDQITVAGAAMLDEKQPKVHYYPGKVDLLFGLYPPTKMNDRNFINLGRNGAFIMPRETRTGHSAISDMLRQLGVDLLQPQQFTATANSLIATTNAQGIIGYDNDADPLNGEANRFNRTSGLIEANQFLTWRCSGPGFWRIHIAYDASDTYTVRMWRALDPLISKAVGEVVDERSGVYSELLREVVERIYADTYAKYIGEFDNRQWAEWMPSMNPNIPTSSSRPAPRRRQ